MQWSKPWASLAALVATCAVMTILTTGSAQAAGSSTWLVGYTANVQNVGWQSEVYDNHAAGTVGQGLRMEALKIQVNSAALPSGASVCYTAYVQSIGSQPQVCNGAGCSSRLSGSSVRWGDGDAGAAEVDEGDQRLG